MISGSELDRFGRKFKGYSPYGICFAFGSLGATTFKFGVSDEGTPALGMQWVGLTMCATSLAALVAWHVLRWPAWFDLSESVTEVSPETISEKPKRRRSVK
jgi:hypothetical protein